jgi:CBS domain-containing protein
MMLIRQILEDARGRLAVLAEGASIADAAKILANPNTPLVIVCNDEGRALGVVSRTDVVKAFSRASEGALGTSVCSIMIESMFTCGLDQTLRSVWTELSARGLRCTPILDAAHKPQGIAHARDIARALLDDVTNEELLLRDYVLGIGYQ